MKAQQIEKLTEFQRELTALINKHSIENASNTPDHILAQVMVNALIGFETASLDREKWYGKSLSING